MSWEPPDLLGPLLKGLQIRSYLEDIKSRREERALRAETHRMNIEAHQQDQALKKFKIQRDLQDAGFLPAAASDTGQNDEAIATAIGGITPENRRPLLEAPGIGRYRAPSQTDRFKRAQAEAQREGTAEGIKEKAKVAITDPTEDIALPEMLGGGTATVKKTDKVSRLLDIYKAANPNKQFHATSPNDDGDVTIWSSTPNGEIKVEKVLDKAGKSKAVTSAGGLTPHQQFQQEHTLKQESRAEQKDVDDAVSAAQALINKATQVDETFPADQRPDPNISPEWKAARIAAEQAARRHPNAVEAGVDANGYPYVKARERSQAAPATAAPAIKVGDKRLVRGKMMTITKVYPDGSFDAK